jgi:AcrR family transcriptional regulator
MADPLVDTLFRAAQPPPVSPEHIASAAPVRTAGTRSRAGNAMQRTRTALLDGARRAVEQDGTKITMAQVAAAAGVAKATLYNHFRTREAVLGALVEDEIQRLVDDSAGVAAAERLVAVANHLAAHPVVRQLARTEPATLAALATVDASSSGWRLARDAVAEALAADGRAGADLVLRWLSSYLVTPASPAEIAADVAVLMAGLPVARAGSDALIPGHRDAALPA